MKLLIVDDEPIIRNGIRKLVDFDSLGIDEVFEAPDGEKAFTLFQKHLPEIILADINMPRMNGLEFSSRIKELRKSTKIALITGYDYFDYAQKALKIGVEDYVLKPVSKEDIHQLLVKLVREVKEESSQSEVVSMIKSYQATYGASDDQGYRRAIVEAMQEGVSDPEFTLSVLADGLGLSVGYISGLFRKYFQVTFKEYLLDKRMEKAKILLLSTEMKNYEVSEAVGIADANYFSTVFKKATGMTPGKFREKVRRSNE